MSTYNEKLPVVSIVMPAYNMEHYIEQAVRSVMKQTFSDWELIVLDDCSKDATCAIVERLAAEDPRIRLSRNEENVGVAKTRDRGIELCRGEYIAFLDSDDVWYSEKLERQLAKIRESGADLVYTSYAIIDEGGEKIRSDYIVPEQVTYQQLLKENHIGCSTVLMKTDVMKRYHFSIGFYHEDYILWIRILKDGCRAAGCGDVLVGWRYIENSRSFNKYRSARNRWRIYRRYLKLSLSQSVWYFCNYALGGVKKYFNINE